MIKTILKTTTICALFFLAACLGSTDDPCKNDIDVSDIAINAEPVRLDREMFLYKKSNADFVKFMDKYPLFSDVFFQRKHSAEDSLLLNEMHKLLNSPYLDTLREETETHFGEMTDVKQSLKAAFQHIKYYYPSFQEPKIYTIVSGFTTDVFVSDSMVVIGLDHFLRNNSRYKPPVMPEYMQRRMTREAIVPMLVMATSNKYMSERSADPASMLDNMIMWGKTYHFMKTIMPCVPDSIIVGYSSKEMQELESNKTIVWNHFIDKKLFFINNHELVTKYVGERPHTYEIGNECPGRIGRWLGWQIVRKYATDKKLSLPELMKVNNPQQIFQEAKYKP